MLNFFYTAKSLDGKTKTGVAEAESVKDLSQKLREEGLFLTKADYKTDQERKGFNFGKISFGISKKVSIGEKMLMTRNLAVMVSTGLPLVKGFAILASQSKSKRMKTALLGISQEVSKGFGGLF